jgi:hypothetical protein
LLSLQKQARHHLPPARLSQAPGAFQSSTPAKITDLRDAKRIAHGHDLGMDAKGPHVTIEFEGSAPERIAGLLVDDQGARVRFDGWLGLASGLERILGGSREPEATDAERPELSS